MDPTPALNLPCLSYEYCATGGSTDIALVEGLYAVNRISISLPLYAPPLTHIFA